MSGATTRSRPSQTGKRRADDDDPALLSTDFATDDECTVTQEFLPPLRWLLQPDAERFAHPAEVEVARLLTFYGVRWAYEPTTFAVRWTSDGRPTEYVTPDFYLPDHDLYLELTTMRQRLVTRKNRKFRLLREGYPNIRVRMLYLRDFERLQRAFRSFPEATEVRVGDTVFSEDEIEARVAELAVELILSWRGRQGGDWQRRPLLVGTGSGSHRFLASLRERVRALGVAVDSDRMELTSILANPGAARARVSRPPSAPITGRHVVLVQEVLNTGLSAAFLASWLRRHGAAGVEVCALLDREAARLVDVPLVCRGFAAPDVALTGYGLARWRTFRDLPDIAVIETD